MIGSFWNLCRATCPAMPIDKQLHSEYRSTYRWHEYTGPRQEVVRRPPIVNGGPGTSTRVYTETSTKPLNEDEFQTDTVSKQEPVMPRRKKYPELAYRHHEFLVSDGAVQNGVDSRARSEERFGPNWRPSRRSKSEGPRRNIEPQTETGERRRESDTDVENMGQENGLLRKAISKISTEYRRQFAWPSGHSSRKDEIDAAPRKSQSMGALKANSNALVHKKRIDNDNRDASELVPLVDDRSNQDKTKDEINNLDSDASWYREVVELRKKAGEYKHRGWGSELAPEHLSDIYNKQIELWDQVSRRSSLSALSLASHMSNKPYTKEDKEEDNIRKVSPTKAYRNAENNAKVIRDIIRHHLERTTGGSELDGLILSPTREKLEPTIPKKDDDSQRSSPKKGSPAKIPPKRGSQKGKQIRSQSVGPTSESSNKEKPSPKRQSRSSIKEGRKSTSNTPSNKRPRPSSLNTARSKSGSVVTKTEDNRLAQTNKNKPFTAVVDSSKQNRKGTQEASEQTKSENVDELKKNRENSQHEYIEFEPVVKSPPEPTRVKSPEQIIMRSPDPVNWTVPLDTGKTFTVTQNVRDGELAGRPQSEVKAWTPPESVPPIAQSAPPALIEGKMALS